MTRKFNLRWTRRPRSGLQLDENYLANRSTPGLSLQKAKFAMGLADHRYLAALARLHELLDRSRVLTRLQFWGLVVGGFVLAFLQTLYTILGYYKQK